MTLQEMYLERAAQGATVAPNTARIAERIAYWCDADKQTVHNAFVISVGGHPSDGPSIAAIIAAARDIGELG